MGRPKMYYEWEIPPSVVVTVQGICRDYERRENAIKYSTITGRVLDRYIELNAAVDDALSEIAVEARESILSDVADNVGYDFSACSCYFSRKIYYLKKRKLIHDIAVKLFLIPK